MVGTGDLNARAQNGLGATSFNTYAVSGISSAKTFSAFFGLTDDATDSCR